ncbi:hypothetical protein EV664_101103 [Stakelama pacifica]|uniref:C2H2-type domain-containing protein n=1 Tax=Stakelama pacifica TaxID=517720 RepID=A0A4R6FXA1_9SPHN|nr:hypothetical protein EV664_101103 [Stakelama pacifica]
MRNREHLGCEVCWFVFEGHEGVSNHVNRVFTKNEIKCCHTDTMTRLNYPRKRR